MVMDSLRYWVQRDARRRLPLRPRAGARPRRPRLRSATRRFFAGVRAGPAAGRREADRRAVGRRPGRLPARRASPRGWVEWNDRFRDAMRALLAAAMPARAASSRARCAGSSDLFQARGARAAASVNFVVAHDGFTLRDLVSYDAAPQRGQRRGQPRRHAATTCSWNCGVEGDSDDPGVLRAARPRCSARCWPRCCSRRACRCCWPATSSATRQQRQQQPLLPGQRDHLDRLDAADEALTAFTARLIALRRARPLLASSGWLTGAPDARGARDLVWLDRLGHEMQPHHWDEADRFVLGMQLAAPADSATPNACCSRWSTARCTTSSSRCPSITLSPQAGRGCGVRASPLGTGRCGLRYVATRPLRGDRRRCRPRRRLRCARAACWCWMATSAAGGSDEVRARQRRAAASHLAARAALADGASTPAAAIRRRHLRRLAGGGRPVAVADAAAESRRPRMLALPQRVRRLPAVRGWSRRSSCATRAG